MAEKKNGSVFFDFYELIIGQLRHDGFETLAVELSSATMIPPPPPSDKLREIVKESLKTDESPGASVEGVKEELDLDESNTRRPSAQPPSYSSSFSTPHQGSCVFAAFSRDGTVAATASEDMSIKVLDVAKMRAQHGRGRDSTDFSRPVFQTLYDHVAPITCLEFHPFSPILASGSQDRTVKFFQYSSGQKRSFRLISDSYNINSLAFHPSGDFMVVATDHPTIRVFDMNTLSGFASDVVHEQHIGPVSKVAYEPLGNVFASASPDGAVKIWDGVSMRCVKTFFNAHGGSSIGSLSFSKSGRYVLTGGRDGPVRVWDLRRAEAAGRAPTPVREFYGAHPKQHSVPCAFASSERHVFGGDEDSLGVVVWDVYSQQVVDKLQGHNNVVRHIATSPVDPGVLTCSEDNRARYWWTNPPAQPMTTTS